MLLIAIFVCSLFIVPRIISTQKFQKVKVKVEYSGEWKGYIFDAKTSISTQVNGTKEYTLNRNCQETWKICVAVKKLDNSANPLTLTILTFEGGNIQNEENYRPIWFSLDLLLITMSSFNFLNGVWLPNVC